jgi:hypothetical protein
VKKQDGEDGKRDDAMTFQCLLLTAIVNIIVIAVVVLRCIDALMMR